MAATPPIVLTIAGFDPSSGAGITADIKTIAAHECFGVSCITALTVQSTRGVKSVVPVAPETITATLAELVSDFEIAAVHVGMLGTSQVVQAVADFLATGVELTNREATTPIWFALQLSPTTFGVFDAFASEEDRQAHLAGNMAKALMSRVDEMLAKPPSVEPVDILGMKNQLA